MSPATRQRLAEVPNQIGLLWAENPTAARDLALDLADSALAALAADPTSRLAHAQVTVARAALRKWAELRGGGS